MKESNSQLATSSPVRLRNAGRSTCDAFKLLLAEIGRSTFGYNIIAEVRLITRFKFLCIYLPELNEYSQLAQHLDKSRNKTEHYDTYFPSAEDLKKWIPQVQTLSDTLPTLQGKLKAKQSASELEAQRNLYVLFLSWLENDLAQIQSAYEGFRSSVPSDIVDSVKSLVSKRARVQELTLEEINEDLETARELIFEMDELSITLDSLMRDAAAEAYGPPS